VERRRTATATGLYYSFCHIISSFYAVFYYIYLCLKKSLNDEERGGNYLIVPERSYEPAPSGIQEQSWKIFVSLFFLRHAQRSNALTDFDAWWLKMRGITQGVPFWG